MVSGLKVGSVWEGRGLRIRVLSVGLAVAWVERLDLSKSIPAKYRIHPWAIVTKHGPGSFHGMTRVK